MISADLRSRDEECVTLSELLETGQAQTSAQDTTQTRPDGVLSSHTSRKRQVGTYQPMGTDNIGSC